MFLEIALSNQKLRVILVMRIKPPKSHIHKRFKLGNLKVSHFIETQNNETCLMLYAIISGTTRVTNQV